MSTGEPEGWTRFALDANDVHARPAKPKLEEISIPQDAFCEKADVDADVEPSPSFDPVAAYLERLGPSSRRTMREALRKMADWASNGRCDAESLPWHLLRIEHTAALRSRLAASVAPATANKHLAALRGVLKQCWRAGVMSAEDYQRAIDIPTVRGESPRRTNRLGPDDLYRLSQVCQSDPTPAGARDAALLALLYGAQLRRSEAVALDLSDYDARTAELRVRAIGTGRIGRFVANADARRALDRWIGVRGTEAGPLFFPVNKGGRIEARRLSEQAIYIACQKRAAEAGLPPTSPEDLRRANARKTRKAMPRSTDPLPMAAPA